MDLRIASATDRGRVREKNEDAVLTDIPLVAVADGMGGHRAGEVASSMALEILASWKERLSGSSGAQAADTLRGALGEANRTIWERGREDENLLGMGTTLTAGWIDADTIALAHVGDTRAYLLRGGKLEQITHDQNVAQDLVRRGRLSEDEAASSPHRHVLLQAIGAEPEGLDIEVASVELRPGDRLLLATDGLHGMVRTPERIRDILLEHADPDEACRALVEEANAAGGEDNVSVVIVDATNGEGASSVEPTPVRVERPVAPPQPPTLDEPKGTSRRWVVLGILAIVAVAAALFVIMRLGSDRLMVAERGGSVVLLRGQLGTEGKPATGDVVYVFTDENVERFPSTIRRELRLGVPVESISEARRVLAGYPRKLGPSDTPTPSGSPSPSPSPTLSPGGSAGPPDDSVMQLGAYS